MKSFFTFIRSFFSIGFLGLIFLFMALALFIGAFSTVITFNSFDITFQRIDALSALEGEVSSNLREMEINESYYAYAMEYGTPVTDELEKVNSYAAQVTQTIDSLIAEGHFTAELSYTYTEDYTQMINDFRTALEQHQQTFQQVVSAYQAEDYENARNILQESASENTDLQAMLKDIITLVNAERMDAAQTFPSDIVFAIQGTSIALIAILLLALWGYRGIALLAQPLINLTNAVIATGGDQYRPELTGAERKLRNPAGRMARSLDAFAKATQQRDAAQKQEINDLREKLYESRRSRLKISGPSR
jgi:methyl-accepting chemotaxis protein